MRSSADRWSLRASRARPPRCSLLFDDGCRFIAAGGTDRSGPTARRNVRVATTKAHLDAGDSTFGLPLDFDHGSGFLRASWRGCPSGRQGRCPDTHRFGTSWHWRVADERSPDRMRRCRRPGRRREAIARRLPGRSSKKRHNTRRAHGSRSPSRRLRPVRHGQRCRHHRLTQRTWLMPPSARQATSSILGVIHRRYHLFGRLPSGRIRSALGGATSPMTGTPVGLWWWRR